MKIYSSMSDTAMKEDPVEHSFIKPDWLASNKVLIGEHFFFAFYCMFWVLTENTHNYSIFPHDKAF